MIIDCFPDRIHKCMQIHFLKMKNRLTCRYRTKWVVTWCHIIPSVCIHTRALIATYTIIWLNIIYPTHPAVDRKDIIQPHNASLASAMTSMYRKIRRLPTKYRKHRNLENCAKQLFYVKFDASSGPSREMVDRCTVIGDQKHWIPINWRTCHSDQRRVYRLASCNMIDLWLFD